jgi:hypothetical protein
VQEAVEVHVEMTAQVLGIAEGETSEVHKNLLDGNHMHPTMAHS